MAVYRIELHCIQLKTPFFFAPFYTLLRRYNKHNNRSSLKKRKKMMIINEVPSDEKVVSLISIFIVFRREMKFLLVCVFNETEKQPGQLV